MTMSGTGGRLVTALLIAAALACPAAAEDRLEQAKEFFRQGEAEKGLDVLRALLKDEPENRKAHELYQDVMVVLDRRAEMMGRYEDLAERHPKSALYAYLLGRLRKALEERLRLYRKAMELDPDFMPARLTLAQELIDAKDFAGARRELESLLKKMPKDERIPYWLGVLARRCCKWDEALKWFGEMAKLAPEDPTPYVEMGKIEKERGRAGKAAEYFKTADAMGAKSVDFLKTYGDFLAAEGKKKEALGIYSRAATLALRPEQYRDFSGRCAGLFVPRPPKALQQKINDLEMKLRTAPEEATKGYEALLESSPKEPALLAAAATAHLVTRELDRAVELAKKALEVCPNYAEPHFLLALVESASMRHKKALEYVKRALELNPFDPQVVREAGYIYLRGGRPSKAAELAVRLWRLTGDTGDASQLLLAAELEMRGEVTVIKEKKWGDKRILKVYRGLPKVLPGYHAPLRAELLEGGKVVRRFVVLLEERTERTDEGPQTWRRWLLVELPLKGEAAPAEHGNFWKEPDADALVKRLETLLKK